MMFFNPDTGEMRFPEGLCLRGGMDAREIDPHFRFTGDQEAVFCLPAQTVEGGSTGVVCIVDGQGLRAVRLAGVSVTGRQQTPGERQRAFLFGLFRLKDPCPDSLQSVRVKAPFGKLTLYTDPVTGQAGAMVEYQRG